MRTQDLRLGNLIYAPLGEIITVTPHVICVLEANSQHGHEPITLTEDLLLKCGFAMHSETEFAINYILPNGIAISRVLKSTPIAERGQFIIGETHDEIAYLHILQNYIYFRYNFELTINL